MNIKRILTHLGTPDSLLLKDCTPRFSSDLKSAISKSEKEHASELRVIFEAGLSLPQLLRCPTARHRAIEVFSLARVWDTEQNTGVLIYLQLADRSLEIVVDRTVAKAVESKIWVQIAQSFKDRVKSVGLTAALLQIIEQINLVLVEKLPYQGSTPKQNELADTPEQLK